MIDITELVGRISETVASHKLDENGAYARWLWQNEDGNRKLGINEYGCADAINIMYTLCDLPADFAVKEAYAQTLQNLQGEETGLFVEETHHPIHTTAHCTAALELLDRKPKLPLTDLQKYLKKENLYDLLENLDWESDPWAASHRGAGIFAALVLTGDADSQWQKWYFDWFWENQDETTGFWRKDHIVPTLHSDVVTTFPNLAGTFHYLFNHEYAKMPLRYPEALIDSCLEIFHNNIWPKLGKHIDFADIDWVYCLNRALRQCNHRFEESKQALKNFADFYIANLYAMDHKTHDGFNDLHMLFGMTCALAELQQALPGYIKSEKPLRLVLDRRPFI
ncbi:MAG: hypothetical protein U0L92_01340 [Clostridia bacterium]|nr:hypothetical protein [Clostridia bacterium]